jgi:hypothetical protein
MVTHRNTVAPWHVKADRNLGTHLLQTAMLGGYINHNYHPAPRNLVVWRGLTRLHDIARGTHIASQ